ncbi:MAG TPA: enoyl-CoA hydratase/isomerase family protein [Ignavibacteriaceae bacterium]|nr:enoyl-CoA hydratase/isomerase family protein [Ignavibacteriaceae bacterium]
MIKYQKENNISIITLNRPEKRNALHPDLVNQLKDKLKEIKNDSEIKVLIITGEGKSFCAGADLEYLNQIKDFSSIENEKDSESLAELFLDIYNLPIPTIAAVNGPAIAGGCGLANVCDFIVADKSNAKFGYSEVKIGFIPAIVSIFLIKKIGEEKAKQLLLTGDIIDSEKAYNMGLTDYLADDVLTESKNLAVKLISNSDFSMKITKKMIADISHLSVNDAVDYCIKLNTISRSSEDFKKGIENFLLKSKDKK